MKKTDSTFEYINVFKGYTTIASNYEKENIPSNTLICSVGNTLKLCCCFFKKKESSKKYLELSSHCVCILLLFIHERIDKKEKNSV